MKYTFYATKYTTEYYYGISVISEFSYTYRDVTRYNELYKKQTTCEIVQVFSGNVLSELRKEIAKFSRNLSMGNGITIHTL